MFDLSQLLPKEFQPYAKAIVAVILTIVVPFIALISTDAFNDLTLAEQITAIVVCIGAPLGVYAQEARGYKGKTRR